MVQDIRASAITEKPEDTSLVKRVSDWTHSKQGRTCIAIASIAAMAGLVAWEQYNPNFFSSSGFNASGEYFDRNGGFHSPYSSGGYEK